MNSKVLILPFETELAAVAALDLGDIHVAAGRLLQRLHHVDFGLLGNHFHHFAGSSADMQVGIDAITLADLGGLLDEGQVVLAEIARAADAQAGGRTTQHDLVRAGHAGGFDARQGIAVVEVEDLLDVIGIIGVIIEHDVVAAIALEEPPVLWNADRDRVHAQLANAIPVVESLFPAPVFIFAHHGAQPRPVAVQILDRFFLLPGRLGGGVEDLVASIRRRVFGQSHTCICPPSGRRSRRDLPARPVLGGRSRACEP